MMNSARFTSEAQPLSLLRIPKPIDIVQLQTTVSTIFTAQSDIDFNIEHLVATNVTGTADYVTIYFVPSAGTAAAANTIAYQLAVPAKSNVTIFDKNNVGLLQPDATLEALCSVNNAVNIWGHGFDYQGHYST